MASRKRQQRTAKDKPRPSQEIPAATVVARRTIDPAVVKMGRSEVIGGAVILLATVVYGQLQHPASTLSGLELAMLVLGHVIGATAIAVGAYHLDRRADQPVKRDPRRWIYGGLGVAFAVFYLFAMSSSVMTNRMPSGAMHLAAIPLFTAMMAAGALVGKRLGWWIAVVGGSLLLLATILLIVRMIASAAFLAGVYGAFGKAASTFALVAAALIVELVALLPICQIRFLMARVGRRAYGM